MKIKILGTRGEIEESVPYHSKHSGVLIDDKLMLDLGEKEFLKYEPEWIFITHFHPDHAYFVRWGKEEIPPTTAKIYAPEKPKNDLLKSKVQIVDKPIAIDGYEIIPIPTHHSKTVKSQAYLVKRSKQSLLYTGDLIWINKEYHHLIGQVDLIITEGSFMRQGGMIRRDKETQQIYGHNGIPNLINLLKTHTKSIVFIHFGAWFYEDMKASRKKIMALGKASGIKTLAGYDGQEIRL